MQILRIVLFFLSPKDKKTAVMLLFLTLVVALLEMAGVASILPFMTVLTNPEIIETNNILIRIFEFFKKFGLQNKDQFIFWLGGLVVIMLFFSLFLKALTASMQIKFINMCGYNISKHLVERYLSQPYSWFLDNHSSDLGKNILSEVNMFIGFINLIIEFISKSFVAVVIVALLIIVDLKIALIVGFFLGVIYGIIYLFSQNFLNKIGNDRYIGNELRYKAVSDAFGAIKEVKLGCLEKSFLERYSKPAKIFALSLSYSSIIKEIPRYVIEAFAFGGMMLTILYMVSKSGNINDFVPIISLYIFAGYRLMPAVQKVYGGFSRFSFFYSSVVKFYEHQKILKMNNLDKNDEVLKFKKEIILKNIYFNYPNTSQATLKNINLTFPSKSITGIIGSTGSGKTTLIDLILGLNKPQKGILEVDGKMITDQNSRSWQLILGYVPQNIYLIDDTIAANIAFGVDEKNIDKEAIINACKIANIHEFIMNELPKNYQATIGERGIKLSGGQRQRIGIARALYHNPKVLILDEATSALDNQTEEAVMEAINNLNKNITVILIAHRLSTVKICDKIFLLEKGELKNQGTFKELIKIDENYSINTKN